MVGAAYQALPEEDVLFTSQVICLTHNACVNVSPHHLLYPSLPLTMLKPSTKHYGDKVCHTFVTHLCIRAPAVFSGWLFHFVDAG